ncbi:MAG TPA: Cof-type HAD-IIB family hydrolase [bacterium]|nr:Cof-type HAD-IIB family hydrolase [bacterium]
MTDIDGTLVPEDKIVRPGVIDAIRRAQGRGIKVCLATGRPWQATQPFVEAVGADPPVIIYNGGLVYDFTNDRVLWRTALPQAVARAVLPVLRRFPQTSPLLFLHGQVYAERITPETALYAHRDRPLVIQHTPSFQALLDASPDEDPLKMLIVGEPPDLRAIDEALGALPMPVNRVFSQKDYLEILPIGNNKGRALPVLAEAVGVPVGETVAVGDAHNDLAMIQTAGLGVAVETSPPDVIAAAAWTCPPPEEEGLRVVIERLFFHD